ncbi:MAG: flavodoxin family protein [Candidatus Methanoperedens sp.]|nr:flavodoxin family protein [Candidatus Methanoperedens sp.]
MKSAIVIYDTSYGNTKTIAETIAEALKGSGFEVRLSHAKDVKELRARDYDLLVIGSPTRMSNMSFRMSRFISSKIKGAEWRDKPFASFDTELQVVIEKGGGSAAEKIAEKLSEKGLKQVPTVLKASVLGIKGPLKEGEIENAKKHAMEWASELKV